METNLTFVQSDVRAARDCLTLLAAEPETSEDQKSHFQTAARVLLAWEENGGFNTVHPVRRRPFAVEAVQRDLIRISDHNVGIMTMAERINAAIPYDMQTLPYGYISNWLTDMEALEWADKEDGDGKRRVPTEKGKELGLSEETRKRPDGSTYIKTVFNKEGQSFVVDNLESIVALQEDRKAKRAAEREAQKAERAAQAAQALAEQAFAEQQVPATAELTPATGPDPATPEAPYDA